MPKREWSGNDIITMRVGRRERERVAKKEKKNGGYEQRR